MSSTRQRKRLVVVGNGMVGQHFLDEVISRGGTRKWEVTAFCEESRPAYDRVALSTLFGDVEAADLALADPAVLRAAEVTLLVGDRARTLDLESRTIRTAHNGSLRFDALILATGSAPFVPDVPGKDLAGTHVFRTVDDVDAIKASARHARTGVVIGGGLLGLEAAHALVRLGLETHVVEFAPRLMPQQMDDQGADALKARIEDLGVVVHTSTETAAIEARPDGAVARLRFSDGSSLETDMVVYSAGIRPRDELARAAGLDIGPRGGIVVDETCRTSHPDVWAIGECAVAHGRVWGLVAPGYRMAEVVAGRLCGEPGDIFVEPRLATKLKVMGVEVASFGDVAAPGVVFSDPRERVYKKLSLSPDGTEVVGGVLVGDTTAFGVLSQMFAGAMPVPDRPEELILPASGGASAADGTAALDPDAVVCSCRNVSKAAVCAAIVEGGLTDVGALKAATGAGTGCGGCAPLLADILHTELCAAGIETSDHLCEHFTYSRQELFDIVRNEEVTTFTQLLSTHGRGRGCEICRPAVASILASLAHGYVLEGEQAALQDTNDHFLANLQKDGTYSVVPRIPGGEITPERLIVLAEVARDFGLYTKITGGQRIDLFGARVEQLPGIWGRLVDAGFESGHAYAKALRTVKSCVGSTWCRYGQQDSAGLAITVELRYRGLRAPHKIKAAVSGCIRECAEARSKDVGVIATERGWNLYVGGNGGMNPAHAQLLAEDLDADTLIRVIDRFLMLYVRTADRLERTSTWLRRRPGGIEELRRIVLDDCLGICEELEADMARNVEGYECEWKATLADPERLARFVTFVNAPGTADPDIEFVSERGQIRPADPGIRGRSPLQMEVPT